ncbi:16S rRNA (cytosine(967)-C(5))-methyltransferase RsmB [Halopseudomonas nanhaiensis]|uniref:16S rRNA (cytosine(967)-C(5))-methyltransferase RsmB n=1 Tax=Halopseudomonas nanhaiensis TaxID=2830842 RepID=UPI001CBEFB20|nr:16S rRNA (cytosine(967)-C(5))-methyltransferase RsmB [Halopseudomonas nanhaiensis]UAW98426.1 16S rRNA (cytosine(967)-C(5))-methyltransferase RsmB [Halopseudomonas nanhaiensis]
MNPRLAAARALAAVSAGKASLGGSLPAQLRSVAPRDQALTQELAFGTARWWPRLDILANALLDKPLKPAEVELQALLLIGLYQLLYMRIPAHAAISETVSAANALKKPWARGMLNAVLRRAQREAVDLLPTLERDPVVVTAHPRWMQKRLKAQWPEYWQAICEANNLHPPMTLRVNLRHGSRETYLSRLTEAGIAAHPTAYSPTGVTLMAPCDVQQLPGFSDGHVSVQDEAAQLAAPLLESAAGHRVLDACCAPGGKTGHLLEATPGLAELVALDAEPLRLERVRENLQRLQLDATLIAADGRAIAQWWDGRPFDRILLDAPCSATGVIRRHPDIKLTRQPDDIERLAALQGELLDQLWQTLAVGGQLVYATCSILPEENTQVIQAFLQREPGARELPIIGAFGLVQPCGRQLLPQPDGHDGFYLARLIKISASTRQDGYTAASKETSSS